MLNEEPIGSFFPSNFLCDRNDTGPWLNKNGEEVDQCKAFLVLDFFSWRWSCKCSACTSCVKREVKLITGDDVQRK